MKTATLLNMFWTRSNSAHYGTTIEAHIAKIILAEIPKHPICACSLLLYKDRYRSKLLSIALVIVKRRITLQGKSILSV